MSEPQQDEKRITNDNKENIPRKEEKSKSESVTVTDEGSLDLSGFQPVVSHTKRDKKNKKIERQREEEVKLNPQRSKRNKSKDKSDKPRKKNGDDKEKPKPANDTVSDSTQSNSAAREDEKKVKFVEAPLPKENPWAKSGATSTVSDDKANDLNLKAAENPKPSEKVQKPTHTVTVSQTTQTRINKCFILFELSIFMLCRRRQWWSKRKNQQNGQRLARKSQPQSAKRRPKTTIMSGTRRNALKFQ